MDYQARLLQHLAEYKRLHLKIAEPGIFRSRGRDLPKAHILPLAQAWLNVPEPACSLAQAHMRAHPNVKRHKYFHHLNSSQAFAFSLFFPFFDGGPVASGVLLRALGLSSNLDAWEPEAIPDPDEGTNLDVRWSHIDGMSLFCEIKLSEREFGRARSDARHTKKLLEIYGPRLRDHVDARLLAPSQFFGSYQILRNIWHLVSSSNSRLLFLLPRANVRLWVQLRTALDFVSALTRDRILLVPIEDVLHAISLDRYCTGPLRDYTAHLQYKYVPAES